MMLKHFSGTKPIGYQHLICSNNSAEHGGESNQQAATFADHLVKPAVPNHDSVKRTGQSIPGQTRDYLRMVNVARREVKGIPAGQYYDFWASEVTSIMDRITRLMPGSSTYYKAVHSACGPAKSDVLGRWDSNGQCQSCKHALLKSRLQKPSESCSDSRQYQPDYHMSWKKYQELYEEISMFRNKPSALQLRIWMELVTKPDQQARLVGNCDEKAMSFATCYYARFPDHDMEIMVLDDPGDHVFVRVSSDQIGTMIIDPWAYRYFPEKHADQFLRNPEGVNYRSLYSFASYLERVGHSMPAKVECGSFTTYRYESRYGRAVISPESQACLKTRAHSNV
ncbi:hypothetical protein [Endozoicomonas sp. ONNA2]|uniref:hypothetical protein n=1 Tax=Endozoicomonas sp. ONNA2 TaxID=2828741 RepID=UPI0021485A6B|nr:hypothetical protein [Endozoicomonas sp. ONNA2]